MMTELQPIKTTDGQHLEEPQETRPAQDLVDVSMLESEFVFAALVLLHVYVIRDHLNFGSFLVVSSDTLDVEIMDPYGCFYIPKAINLNQAISTKLILVFV